MQNFQNTSRVWKQPIWNILCSMCNVQFCSLESLVLHSNSCEGPKIKIPEEKLQIKIAEKFSCSQCDMDFNLEGALKEHSENCEIALAQPEELHFDHTYSKATNLKVNLFGTNGKEQKFFMKSFQVLN